MKTGNREVVVNRCGRNKQMPNITPDGRCYSARLYTGAPDYEKISIKDTDQTLVFCTNTDCRFYNPESSQPGNIIEPEITVLHLDL